MREEYLGLGVIGLLVVLLAGLISLFVFQSRVEAHCLRIGWAGASVAWNFDGYCITRIDQTDVVVPWREAKPR